MHPRILQALTSVVTASLFTSCAVGPNHRPTVVDVPVKFRNAKGESPESIADLAWWKVFQDPELQGLIREALQNNYDLKIAVARVSQARAVKMQATSSFFPGIGYALGAERQQLPATQVPATNVPATSFDVAGTTVEIPGSSTPARDVRSTPVNSFSGTLNASWEVDLWGKIRRSNEAALAQLLATEEAQRGVMQSLVAEVAQTYFQLLEADEELKISRDAMASFGQSLELFTKQQRGGIASDLEVARGTASQANAAASIPKIERQITILENSLSTLLGRAPGPIKRGRALLAQHTPPKVPAGIPSDLLLRRPDIRQAEQQVVAANAQVGVAVANFFPSFNLTAAAGAVSPSLDYITNGSWNVWSVGGALQGPIFQGGLFVGRYKEAKAVWEQNRLQYQKTVNNAFGEVSNALITRQKYAEARVQQETQVEALKKSVKLSMDRYTIGISTYYEVLEAQQQLFPAEVSLAQTRLQQLLAVVDLYRSLGGGWSDAKMISGPVNFEAKEAVVSKKKKR